MCLPARGTWLGLAPGTAFWECWAESSVRGASRHWVTLTLPWLRSSWHQTDSSDPAALSRLSPLAAASVPLAPPASSLPAVQRCAGKEDCGAASWSPGAPRPWLTASLGDCRTLWLSCLFCCCYSSRDRPLIFPHGFRRLPAVPLLPLHWPFFG